MNHAISLARILEERLNRQKQWLRGVKTVTTHQNVRKEQLTPGKATIKRLTWAELQARKEKGLFFNCDEKYIPGHKCQLLQVYILQEEDEGNDVVKEAEDGDEAIDVTEFGVSVQALAGGITPLTLRFSGRMG